MYKTTPMKKFTFHDVPWYDVAHPSRDAPDTSWYVATGENNICLVGEDSTYSAPSWRCKRPTPHGYGQTKGLSTSYVLAPEASLEYFLGACSLSNDFAGTLL